MNLHFGNLILLVSVFFAFSVFSCSDKVTPLHTDNDISVDDESGDKNDSVEDADSEEIDNDIDDDENDADSSVYPDRDDDTGTDYDDEDTDDEDPDTDFDPCTPNPCEEVPLSDGVCTSVEDGYECGCENGYEWDEDACVDINECLDDFLNDCDENAQCNNETGSYSCVCNENYSGDGTSCIPDSREVDCTNTKPDNSTWKAEYADGKITQTWNGEEFLPSDDSCQWECITGYHKEGEVCLNNIRPDQSCTGLPENASWNIAEKIDQTWNGSDWVPSTTGYHNPYPSNYECRFKCDSYHSWIDPYCSLCDLDSRCGETCSECPGDKAYCKNNGDNTTECVECYSNEHCSDPLPLCDPEKNICVECVDNEDCGSGEMCTVGGDCIEDPCDPDPCIHDNLIAGFNLDEGTGTVAEDLSGNGYNAQITGAVWTTDGRYGSGLEFYGDGDHIEWDYTPPTNSFTMEAWIKAEEEIEIKSESTGGEAGISGQKYLFWPEHGGTTDGGAGVSVGTNGISVYEHGSDYMPALAVFSEEIGMEWNHIVVTYTNKQPRIYLNGSLVKTGLKSSRTVVFAPDIAGGGNYGWFKGTVDHIKIYNKALTDDEVFQAYSKSSYCTAGTVEGDYHCGCDYGWEWDETSSVCIPKIYTCSPIPYPDAAEWNTVSEYLQKWNSDEEKWEPEDSFTQYNEEPDDSSCRFKCIADHRWDGSKCAPKPTCIEGDKLGGGVFALDLLKAMDICDVYDPGVSGSWGIVSGSAVIGKANWSSDPRSVDDRQYGVKTNFGTDTSNTPLWGDNMAVLSSGRARDEADTDPTEDVSYDYEKGSPPADFISAHDGNLPVTREGCPNGTGANDSVMLRVQLKVPLFANAFSFDFRFFSQEYWKYTCSAYNDFFITMLDTEWVADEEAGETNIPDDKNISFDSSGNYISVNSEQFFTVCHPKGDYLCPDGTNALDGTGYNDFGQDKPCLQYVGTTCFEWGPNAGATRWLTTTAPVVPGEIITLRFIIWDTSDMNLDSLVLLDNFRWHARPGTGPATFACWDLNKNGECDLDTEDINGDSVCSERDC